MNKKTVKDIDLKGKKVFVRCDFNVPMDENQNITDNTRIVAALPTIKYLLEQNCKIVLASHLGRPKGEFKPEFSLAPVAKELKFLGNAVNNPERPFVAILGGAKVSDKIGVIDSLLEKVDTLMIGGGMAYTFFKAQGYGVGNSLCELDKLDLAKSLMEKAKAKGVKLMLPVDTVVGKEFKEDTESKTVAWTDIPDDWEGFDIGEKTIEMFSDELKSAKTVVWNGPLGLFEFAQFAKGTNAIAKVLSELDATTIIGGGDSAAAVKKAGLQDKMTHISTGGGASLEFLEGKKLPGIECLQDK